MKRPLLYNYRKNDFIVKETNENKLVGFFPSSQLKQIDLPICQT